MFVGKKTLSPGGGSGPPFGKTPRVRRALQPTAAASASAADDSDVSEDLPEAPEEDAEEAAPDAVEAAAAALPEAEVESEGRRVGGFEGEETI